MSTSNEEEYLTPAELETLARTAIELFDQYGDPDDILSAHQADTLAKAEGVLHHLDGPGTAAWAGY